jgi:2-isopropylmalate synthase
MQIEFSTIVQALADTNETELTSEQIWTVFAETYLARALGPIAPAIGIIACLTPPKARALSWNWYPRRAACHTRQGVGNGPLPQLSQPLVCHCGSTTTKSEA